jgi:hypothetical protein
VVEVVEQRADGHAHGRLRNRPARLVGIDIEDLVPFEPENVIAIGYKRSVNPLTPSIVGPAGCLRGSAALAPRAAEIAAVLGTPIGEVSTASRGRRLREKLSH